MYIYVYIYVYAYMLALYMVASGAGSIDNAPPMGAGGGSRFTDCSPIISTLQYMCTVSITWPGGTGLPCRHPETVLF